jgi:hypothetical protein
VRRICKGAVRVQLELGGSEAETWELVNAIEWQPESGSAIEWQPESVSVIERQPEPAADDDTKESAESAQEEHSAESATIMKSLEWIEWPEDPGFQWSEELETAAAVGIKEAVQYLFEGVIEGAEKASADWARLTLPLEGSDLPIHLSPPE